MNAVTKKRLKTWLLIALFCLGIHDLMLVLAVIINTGSFSFAGLKELALSRLTQPGDAPWYLEIAKNGYATAGENVIDLVFYPLYPFLMRLLGYVTGDLAAAGLLISRTAYCAASILLYELILIDADERSAWDGTLLMALYPYSMFVMGVFTEGLFLALTIGTLLAIRKRKFAAAGVIGFFAALTRTQGMLLIFPAVYELVVLRLGAEKRKIKWSDAFTLLIPAGFGVYLFINYALHGNPLQFLIYEAGEPWYQSTRWVGDNIAQHYHMALDYDGLSWFIYWVQIALYFLTMATLLWGLIRKERIMYLLYGGVYLGFTYLSGWMISGGRYMLCCVPVYIVLSKIKDGPIRKGLIALAGFLFFAYSLFFLRAYAIM